MAERDVALAEARAELLHRDLLIETMRVQLARLRRMQFGASSEKLSQEIAQLELALEELEAAAAPVAQTSSVLPKPDRPAPVRALPAHLPREDVVAEPPSGTCTCPDCGGALRKLGDDSAEQLDVAPVQWRVVRTIRPKDSCRSCDKIVQAPVPVRAVARGKATFATLAHIITSKFDHHLPLYRQAEMMAAQGIDTDRSTLAGWTGQASALLDPIISQYAPSDFQLKQMLDILRGRLVARGIDVRCLDIGDPLINLAGARQAISIQQGIEQAFAKKIIAAIKTAKIKVETSINGDKLRISAKKRDDLQLTIALLRKTELELPVQFENFRD